MRKGKEKNKPTWQLLLIAFILLLTLIAVAAWHYAQKLDGKKDAIKPVAMRGVKT